MKTHEHNTDGVVWPELTYTALRSMDVGPDVCAFKQIGDRRQFTVVVVSDYDHTTTVEECLDYSMCEDPVEVLDVSSGCPNGTSMVFPKFRTMPPVPPPGATDEVRAAREAQAKRLMEVNRGISSRMSKWDAGSLAALGLEETEGHDYEGLTHVGNLVLYHDPSHPTCHEDEDGYIEIDEHDCAFVSVTEYLAARLDMRWELVPRGSCNNDSAYLFIWSREKMLEHTGNANAEPSVEVFKALMDGRVYGYRVFRTENLYDLEAAASDLEEGQTLADVEDWDEYHEHHPDDEDACWGCVCPDTNENYALGEGVSVAEHLLKKEQEAAVENG